MALLPDHAGPAQRLLHAGFLAYCGLVFAFLILPLVVIVPLSFNAEPYFTLSRGMLTLDPAAFSLRWYEDFFGSAVWRSAAVNSLIVATVSTLLATVLGTLAALGLSRPQMPCRQAVTALLISPLIVPLIIAGAGMYFVFARLGLVGTFAGLVLSHTVLGAPFVLITVTATLSKFDTTLVNAAAISGAGPVTILRRVTLPIIAPGVVSGAIFAFGSSLDEIVVTLFIGSGETQTVPRQMWVGLRGPLSPPILAVATLLIALSVLLLACVGLLRRLGRGRTPA